ncbi:hypothetical protein [Pseudomonas nitroreducens]|uniref:hypothetical protein n=1 Tax=Pseudomonas nitroreducens TaxID=46680 RepID=UPI00351D9DB1
MRNLKVVPQQPKPTVDQLAEMLKARVRVINGESWVPVRDLKEVINHIVGGAQ